MLLFKKEHVKPIMDDIKTQTRRSWKKKRVNVDSIQRAKLKMLSKEFFAELRILEVFQQPLGEMTEQDAYEEGGYTLESYKKIFKEIYGFWDDEYVAWVVKFKRISHN